MDMKGLAKALCGLGSELEKETSGTKAFKRVMDAINDNIDGENDEWAEIQSIVGRKIAEYKLGTGTPDAFVGVSNEKQDPDVLKFNLLQDVQEFIRLDEADEQVMYSEISQRFAEMIGTKDAAEDVIVIIDENMEEEEPEAPASGGEVKVQAHAREGGAVHVQQYTRSAPKKEGDSEEHCLFCHQPATFEVKPEGKVSYLACGEHAPRVEVDAELDLEKKGKQVISIETYMRSNPHSGEPQQVKSHVRGVPKEFTRTNDKGQTFPMSRAEVFKAIKNEIKARLDETPWVPEYKEEVLKKVIEQYAPAWTDRHKYLYQPDHGMRHMQRSDVLMTEKFSMRVKDEVSPTLLKFREDALAQIDRIAPKKQVKAEGDSVRLFNQPLAAEGVLPYHIFDPKTGGYKIVHKMKKWDDLKQNIGLVVPITDEHPDRNNGADGLVAQTTKTYGRAKIKQCPKGGHMLCFDAEFDDGAPIRPGYSAGYKFAELLETGEFKGKKYDMVQGAPQFNHVAMTRVPRYEEALAVAGDSKPCPFDGAYCESFGVPEPPAPTQNASPPVITGDAAGHIYAIAYDSYRIAASPSPHREGARFKQIVAKLKLDNPDTDNDTLCAYADNIYRNEQRRRHLDQ